MHTLIRETGYAKANMRRLKFCNYNKVSVSYARVFYFIALV